MPTEVSSGISNNKSASTSESLPQLGQSEYIEPSDAEAAYLGSLFGSPEFWKKSLDAEPGNTAEPKAFTVYVPARFRLQPYSKAESHASLQPRVLFANNEPQTTQNSLVARTGIRSAARSMHCFVTKVSMSPSSAQSVQMDLVPTATQLKDMLGSVEEDIEKLMTSVLALEAESDFDATLCLLKLLRKQRDIVSTPNCDRNCHRSFEVATAVATAVATSLFPCRAWCSGAPWWPDGGCCA